MTLLSLPYWNRVFHWVLMIFGCALNIWFGGWNAVESRKEETRKDAVVGMLFSLPFLALGLHFAYMIKVFLPWPPLSKWRMPWPLQLLHFLLNLCGVAFVYAIITTEGNRRLWRRDKSVLAMYTGLLLHFTSMLWVLRPSHKRTIA